MAKKQITLSGWPVDGIILGKQALIASPDEWRMTSRVIAVPFFSDRVIRFETENTLYTLNVNEEFYKALLKRQAAH